MRRIPVRPGLVMLYSSFSAVNRASGLTPVTAAALEDTRPGEDVLVEGRISSRNPVQSISYKGMQSDSHGFVAYICESREVDEKGDARSWSVNARVTPLLLLDLPDGLVQVGNDDHELENPHTIEQEKALDEPSTTRHRGIAVDDTVIVVGAASAGPELPQVDADFIAHGIRERYIPPAALAA